MGDEVFGTWIEAGDREGPSCSFRQAWDAAGAVAHTLVNGWGVKPGDRVLLCYNFGYEGGAAMGPGALISTIHLGREASGLKF